MTQRHMSTVRAASSLCITMMAAGVFFYLFDLDSRLSDAPRVDRNEQALLGLGLVVLLVWFG